MLIHIKIMKINILNVLYALLALFLLVKNYFAITEYNYKNTDNWNTWVCIPKCSDDKKRFSIDILKDELYTAKDDTLYISTSDYEEWGSNYGEDDNNNYGLPKKADIIYFSEYEDKFYEVKIDFNPDYLKKAFKEIHYSNESDIYDDFAKANREAKGHFNGLVFGFAPKGFVVVWMVYGNFYRKELGKFQAIIVKGDKKYDEKIISDHYHEEMTRKEIRETNFIPNISSKKWNDYHKRYNLKIETVSENKGFKIFEKELENYNGESLYEFRPEILNQTYSSKALPKNISVYWETGLNQKFQGNLFFNEKELFEKFKDSKPTDNQDLQIKIAKNNVSIEVLLNNEPLKMDSIRIWGMAQGVETVYKESYK